jgi:hypothetical protein
MPRKLTNAISPPPLLFDWPLPLEPPFEAVPLLLLPDMLPESEEPEVEPDALEPLEPVVP